MELPLLGFRSPVVTFTFRHDLDGAVVARASEPRRDRADDAL